MKTFLTMQIKTNLATTKEKRTRKFYLIIKLILPNTKNNKKKMFLHEKIT